MGKVAIVQFDNRNDQDLGMLEGLIARNSDYANMHGYHHAFERHAGKDVPVYWYKVDLIEKYLASGFDIVAWLDSDAVIHDLTISIDSLFEDNEAFVFSSDLPIWKSVSPFNAGVFFCKGEFARELMQEWRSLFPAHLWEKKGNEWICKDDRWAGPAYEQGTFAEKLLPKYRSSPAFKQVSWKMLQSPYPLKESFTLHFATRFRINCVLYLSDLGKTFGLSQA